MSAFLRLKMSKEGGNRYNTEYCFVAPKKVCINNDTGHSRLKRSRYDDMFFRPGSRMVGSLLHLDS